jgi:hypothetical protein
MQQVGPEVGASRVNRPHVQALGRRIELISMDPHFHDITIGLYEQQAPDGALVYLIHSYSGVPGTAERLRGLGAAMAGLGGLVVVDAEGRRLRFGCGKGHRLACRRLMTDAGKLKPGTPAAARPLQVADRTTGRTITVEREAGATYRGGADGLEDGRAQRIGAIGRGLARLCEMELIGEDAARVRFGCGQYHDELIGLLLPRALNLRAAMREQEEAMGRGLLVAPSAQKS